MPGRFVPHGTIPIISVVLRSSRLSHDVIMLMESGVLEFFGLDVIDVLDGVATVYLPSRLLALNA